MSGQLFPPDPYRWPAHHGVIHPGRDAEGDACNCPGCGRRRVAAWIKAGRPPTNGATP